MDLFRRLFSKRDSKIYIQSSILHPPPLCSTPLNKHPQLKKTPSYEDTTKFIAPIKSGVVVKVYDGDTFTLATKLPYDNSPLFRFSVHMRGLVSPDLKSVSPLTREEAKISRGALSELILTKIVNLDNIESDRYGNLVADVYYNGIYINEWMISNDYSEDYDSGSKKEYYRRYH